MTDIEKQGHLKDTDSQELAQLGYKQEFEREWNFFSTFSYAFSMSGLLGSIAITLSYPIINGGACAILCWLTGCFGCLAIAYSVAEIVSEFPSSGSLTYALSQYVSEKQKGPMSWLIWWLYIVGCVTSTASGDFGCAQVIAATVSAASDFKVVLTPWQVSLIAMAVMVTHAFWNSLPSRYQSAVTKYYCVINICTTIALMIHLLVKSDGFNSASYMFTHIENNTGWSNMGWSFCFGYLQVSWVLTSYDGVARISEESKDAAYKVPLAIGTALTATAVLGWVLIVVLVACMGQDLQAITNSPAGNPFIAIVYRTLGRTATTAYMSLIIVIIWFTGCVGVCSLSRTYWAFARDRGLPFHKYWCQLDKRTGVPVRCVWLITGTNVLLSLINIGSEVAIQAIFSACAIATDWSYVVCIIAHMFNREKYGVPHGPFNMGKLSKPVNAFAISWTAFVSVVFLCPNYIPVTAENMNYSCVMLGAAFIGAGGWYMLDAHRWYNGPVSNLEDIEAILDNGVASTSLPSSTSTVERTEESPTAKA